MNNITTRTVSDLIDAVIPCIEAKDYSRSYIKGFKCIFRQLKVYCDESREEYFTVELGQRFLRDCYGIKPGTVLHKFSRSHRAMDLLADFQHFGTVMIRRRLDRQFPQQLSESCVAYLNQLCRDGKRPNTVGSHRKSLYKLTDYLDSAGIGATADISLEVINRYVATILCNYGKQVAQLHLSIMRKFLHYLFDNDLISTDIACRLIDIRFSNQPVHLPSTFTTDQIEKILSCVDRESPQGKRDYAVLMLAAKLGIRTSDIRNLKPENIDWVNHCLSFVQVKTGEPLTLPLPTDVGWALIDYIKNGRPSCSAPEIFLRAVAPYISLQNFDNILVKYMQAANIPMDCTKHHGLHTLRHSLATHMLDEKIPITAIQSVLGHVNTETTQRYTGIDVKQLKLCALEVPVI